MNILLLCQSSTLRPHAYPIAVATVGGRHGQRGRGRPLLLGSQHITLATHFYNTITEGGETSNDDIGLVHGLVLGLRLYDSHA